MEKRYLKQLVIAIKSEKEEIRMQSETLAKQLEQQGLQVEQRFLQEGKAKNPEGEKRQAACLYLTDCGELAGHLLQEGVAVIAWLHEANQNEDFGQIRYAVEEPVELDGEFFEQIYRRYRGIPWTIARTARCVIRETVPEDAFAFAQIYQDPKITEYTEPFCAEARTEQETIREYISKFYEFYGYGVWTVLLRETGEVIGRVGFEQPEAPALGYMIAGPRQGRGLATECCQAVLRVAGEELGFTQVQARIHRENAASLRVIEKLGFVRCGSEGEETLWRKKLFEKRGNE